MKIDIVISGNCGSGKTTMAQFLYSILHKYEFDFNIIDDGNCIMDLSKINISKFNNFIPLKSKVCITVREASETTELEYGSCVKVGIDEIIGTNSWNKIQNNLFNKGNQNDK